MTPSLAGCTVCHEASPRASCRRFGGQRVCQECWNGLSRFERVWAFRGFSRANLVALFAAEVAVRQPGQIPSGPSQLAV